LRGQLSFPGIAALVEATLEAAGRQTGLREPDSIDEALAIDQNARSMARGLLPEIAAKAS